MKRKAFFFLGFLFAQIFLCAQEKPIAFKGALIYPVTGIPINDGVLVIQNGKILSIGPAGTKIPPDATVLCPGW